jgi:hypothetical protein
LPISPWLRIGCWGKWGFSEEVIANLTVSPKGFCSSQLVSIYMLVYMLPAWRYRNSVFCPYGVYLWVLYTHFFFNSLHNIYYSLLLHISATEYGHVQIATSFTTMYNVYCNQPCVNGKCTHAVVKPQLYTVLKLY